MKYPELIGKCKNCTLGCFRLEDPSFIGTDKCQYAEDGFKKCQQIIEQMKMEGLN